MRGAVAILIALLVAGAGCVAPDEPESVAGLPGQPVTEATAPWEIRMTDCVQAAGVSVYPRAQYAAVGPPEPWVAADISGDIGSPRAGSVGGVVPPVITSGAAGHYHVAVDCADVIVNGSSIGSLSWGWVGVYVETPAWDNQSIDRHALMAVFSWPHAESRHLLHSAAHATVTEAAAVSNQGGLVQMLLDDEDHGRYEGASPVVAAADKGEHSMRMWFLLPTSGMHNHGGQEGPFTPVSLDLSFTGMSHAVAPETVAPFVHSQTDHHAPLPGLGGNAGFVYEAGFDVVLRAGPTHNQTFEKTWVH